ncbi:hypothetical protein JCM14469_21620 [Desulfatiferula olefinivorans]
MMAMFSTEFWILFQMLAIVILLGLLVYFIRHGRSVSAQDQDQAADCARRIVALMEPLLNEADAAARVFEGQIAEKKQLIRDLNDKLDSRIISLNLLLNRADACLDRARSGDRAPGVLPDAVMDTQQAILDLYRRGLEPAAIAEKLSVPAQEVDLVIALKKKCTAMEQDP